MHKDPVGKRFIAGSKKCSNKVISKLFSKCLKLILNHLKKYDKVVFNRTGLKCYWIIDNSIEFLNDIENLSTNHLESYDFSTLYTMLPHNRIKEALGNIFRKVFTRESKTYINVYQHKAYFSNQNSRGFTSFREMDLDKILLFILENIYVRFGNKVAKQKIGIPIGLDSGYC